MFDDENFYVSARCWDSAPPEQVGRQRDAPRRQPGCGRTTTSASCSTLSTIAGTATSSTRTRSAARVDHSDADEGNSNSDWNPVWDVRDRPIRGRLDGRDGDPVQVAPLRSGIEQMWGIQMRRAIRRKNEWAHLTPLPHVIGGAQAVLPHLGRRHARRPRTAAGQPEHRAEAVRHRARRRTDRCCARRRYEQRSAATSAST